MPVRRHLRGQLFCSQINCGARNFGVCSRHSGYLFWADSGSLVFWGTLMDGVIRVTVFHRSRLLRDSLASVLSNRGEFEVTSAEGTVPDSLAALREAAPEVVLTGLNLPDPGAAGLTRYVRSELPDTKVVLIAHSSHEDGLYQCFAQGIHGCVLEDSPVKELELAIRTVVRGEAFCQPQLVCTLFEKLTRPGHSIPRLPREETVSLTPREMEIVQLIEQRLSNGQIARHLSVSLHTVKNHVHNVLEKLQVNDRFEAAEFARRRGWMPKEIATSLSGRMP